MTKPLEVRLEGEREIVVTRSFAAPRELVFDCWTIPALIRRWLGPPDWVMTTCEFDARVGGAWRFVSRGPDGFEMGHGGVIRELVRPERIVTSERYDMDWTGGETLNTNLFDALGPRETLSTLRVLYASREGRDGAAATPMARGLEQGFAKMDALLVELAAS